MSPLDAIDAMFGVFKAVWDPLGFEAFYDDKTGKKPTSDLVWARATIQHATGNQSSLPNASGKRRYTETGTITVQVFAPVGDGSTAGYEAATSVRNAYREARLGELLFKQARIEEASGDGAFKQTNVLVTFSYDDVR